MNSIQSLLASLLVPLFAMHAAAQSIEVNVETRIRLEANGEADVWMWQAPPALTVEQRGNVLLVDGPAGKYRVNVTALTIDWEAQRFEQQTGFIDFEIGTPAPDPDVPDVPDDPDVPVPVDRFGLTQLAASQAKLLPVNDRTRQVRVRMPDGNTVSVSVIDAIAASYFDAAEQIRTGDLSDPQIAIDSVRQQNQLILGTQPGEWPGLFSALGNAANQRWTDGVIANIDDWAIAFDEISNGLKQAR